MDDREQELYTLKIPEFSGLSLRIDQRVRITRRHDFIKFAASLESPQNVSGFVVGRAKVNVLRRTLYLDLKKEFVLRGLGPLDTTVHSIANDNGRIGAVINTTYDASNHIELDFGPSNMTLYFGKSILGHVHGSIKLEAGTTRIVTVVKMNPTRAMYGRDLADLKSLITRGKDVPLGITGADNDQSAWASACIRSFRGVVHLSSEQAKVAFPEIVFDISNDHAI